MNDLTKSWTSTIDEDKTKTNARYAKQMFSRAYLTMKNVRRRHDAPSLYLRLYTRWQILASKLNIFITLKPSQLQ